eukprot:TRINITY_DN648_c0_g1_i7.p1 TRINITY_DN648_c0_g1~~TRINITY_DN648_c0_g1_i7.p1  ORF type:complete len:103 (+),score=9.74 TRINITY_DN648_c0_g1_i7:29-337(+)
MNRRNSLLDGRSSHQDWTPVYNMVQSKISSNMAGWTTSRQKENSEYGRIKIHSSTNFIIIQQHKIKNIDEAELIHDYLLVDREDSHDLGVMSEFTSVRMFKV